jgi:hypothetical protein
MPSIEEMQQTIAQQAERLAAIDRAASEAHIVGAIGAAVDQSGVKLHPGARDQVVGLLRGQVSTLAHEGQSHVVGPGLRPLADHVKDQINSDAYAHFRVSGATPARPVADARAYTPMAQLGAVLKPMTAPTGAGDSGYGAAPVDRGQSAGIQIMQQMAEQRAAQQSVPAAYDMSQSFGLKPQR